MPAILQVTPPSPRGSRPIPTWSRSLVVTCTNDLPTTSAVTRRPRRFRPVPHGPASGGGKSEGNPGCHLTRVPPTSSPRSSVSVRVLRSGDRPELHPRLHGPATAAVDGRTGCRSWESASRAILLQQSALTSGGSRVEKPRATITRRRRCATGGPADLGREPARDGQRTVERPGAAAGHRALEPARHPQHHPERGPQPDHHLPHAG